MQDKLNEYAKLLIGVGLNVQKGQDVVINSPVDCAPFARMCVSAAYDAGARDVTVMWRDDYVSREHWLKASDDVFDSVPEWQVKRNLDFANRGCAWLSISASNPENLKGVDSDRLAHFEVVSGKAEEEFHTKMMNSDFPWCVASIPVASWANKVFPDCDGQQSIQKLWDAIFASVRITGDGSAVEKWRKHCDFLEVQSRKLCDYNFRKLHYTNSLGTDLTVELPEGHIWMGGAEKSGNGINFVANMPTEEIFTAPLRNGVNGTVFASKPLVISGNVIENFYMTFKDGKITEVHAEKGEDILKKAIAIDEGASYLGEVALVPFDSPISNSGILFYNTLFDENASCHLAFGNAYSSCIRGGNDMSAEELLRHGVNNSNTHCDFMIGTRDLKITGTTHDGREIAVFENGNFAF